MILATSTQTALWYLTRSTGAVCLILLTISLALGIADVRRVQTATLPRFVVDRIHRDAALLALALLAVHILTSLIDGFAPITIVDVFIPFTSAYRPIWLGLGAFASDLIIALIVTSLVRERIGYRTWRTVHWAAYACWPIAVVHGLGTGSDTKSAWMLLVTAACTIVVVAAVWIRASAGWPDHRGLRVGALSAVVLFPVGILAWLPGGPLGADWARRAGTPASLIARPAGGSTASPGSSSPGPSTATGAFQAQASGTVHQGQTASGLAEVEVSLALQGTPLSTLDIRLFGTAQPGGGLSMSSSRVTLGPPSDPAQYRGTITALQGTNLAATVSRSDGSALALTVQLQLDQSGGTATGTVSAQPVGG